MALQLESVAASRIDEVISVFCDAFYVYPVMRYVVGPGHADVDRRLAELIRFFVMRRVRQGAPVLGMIDGGSLVAVLTLTMPVEADVAPETLAHRDRLWLDLGDDARERYDAYANACQAFAVDQPHHHVNMIGVRRSHIGRGLARPLLDAVRTLSEDDETSSGVTLTTEVSTNVTLYQHFGYDILGYRRIAPELESWGFFLPTKG